MRNQQINKFRKAKTQMVLDMPFFGSLALRLKTIETSDVETMATDGRRLWWNPEFVESLTLEHVKGVLAHEVMHCALHHNTRRGQRDPAIWNQAADHAINLILKASGIGLPDCALADPQFQDMPTEKIYDALINRAEQSKDSKGEDEGQDSGKGEGAAQGSASGDDADADAAPNVSWSDESGCGVVVDARDEEGRSQTGAEAQQLEHEWKIATVQAANSASAVGRMPGGMESIIDEMKAPKVDWRDVLRAFLSRVARNDYSWKTYNRHMIGRGLYLPGMRSEDVGKIVVAIDTSGSVSDALLQQFGGELGAILEDVRPESIEVIYCDTRINHRETLEPDDLPFTLHAKGRGGTSFAPVFDALQEMDRPECVIYFTDMYASDWGDIEDPGVPVLWADYDGGWKGSTPFGDHVVVE